LNTPDPLIDRTLQRRSARFDSPTRNRPTAVTGRHLKPIRNQRVPLCVQWFISHAALRASLYGLKKPFSLASHVHPSAFITRSQSGKPYRAMTARAIFRL